ncbi:DUF551 domain-containing protein [Acinetobacter bohemicus]|uniref:DUF551 domain-containing protein n=1 Tax=Acinetobacter sp. S4397-1 TaxID=2972915 RepID=UPI00209B5ED7|nr:DUF551 domain-containing protein [Acinetobacter sp. S4397-1]MCO8044947.1 DUF551 domain-containing protein [Acinetobacter sp. S4397-1]
MDIKNTIISAEVVIESLITLLKNEDVDISSIQFSVGDKEKGIESENMSFESLIHLTLSWLSEAKARVVPEWISVNDKLPPANILVLGMSQTRSNLFNIYNVMALDEFEEADVTYWMHLPEAPTGSDS